MLQSSDGIVSSRRRDTAVTPVETAWLDGIPAEEDAAEKKRVAKHVAEEKRTALQIAFTKAKRDLKWQHRRLLECSLLLPSVREANDLFRKWHEGKEYSTWLLSSWRRRKDFKLAYALGQKAMLEDGEEFTREGVMRRNEQIYQDAMEPHPVLYKGEPTGFFQRELRHALTALDQRSKIMGLYGDEKQDVAVTLNIDFGSYGDTVEGEIVDA